MRLSESQERGFGQRGSNAHNARADGLALCVLRPFGKGNVKSAHFPQWHTLESASSLEHLVEVSVCRAIVATWFSLEPKARCGRSNRMDGSWHKDCSRWAVPELSNDGFEPLRGWKASWCILGVAPIQRVLDTAPSETLETPYSPSKSAFARC